MYVLLSQFDGTRYSLSNYIPEVRVPQGSVLDPIVFSLAIGYNSSRLGDLKELHQLKIVR